MPLLWGDADDRKATCPRPGRSRTGETCQGDQNLRPQGDVRQALGDLSLFTDKITFCGEAERSDDITIKLADLMDANDRSDGGQQLGIIGFKDSRGSMSKVEYDDPSTFGERLSTPNDRRTSWNDRVRVINDLVIQSKM